MKPKKGKRLKTVSNKVKKTRLVSLISMLILIAVIATIILGIYLSNNGKIQIAGFDSKSEEIKAATLAVNKNFTVEDTYGVIWQMNTNSSGHVNYMLIEGSSRGESEDIGSESGDIGKQIDEAYMPGNGEYYVKDGNTIYTVIINYAEVSFDAIAPYVTRIEKMYYYPGYESYVSKLDSQMKYCGSGIINTEARTDRNFAFTGYGSAPIYLEVEDTWGVKWELRRDPDGNITYMNIIGSKNESNSDGIKTIPIAYLPPNGTYSALYNGKTYSVKINYNYNDLNEIGMDDNVKITDGYISNIGGVDITGRRYNKLT